jgi:hypothetical protein
MLAIGSFIPATTAHAGILDAACGRAGGSSATCKAKSEGSSREGAAKQVQGVINLILMLLGILAVIMIIIGGYRYVTANGDEGSVKQGKDTILYSCIGLVLAIMSYGIVNFIVDRMSGK